MPSNPSDCTRHNFYQILGVSRIEESHRDDAWAERLKTAYHQTLLVNHPDKGHEFVLKHGASSRCQQIPVDVIMMAYQTLSDPAQRATYDLKLRTQEISGSRKVSQGRAHPGAETLDLEELDYDEGSGTWSKACRCGNEGYHLTETDLDQNGLDGEIFVGCQGCSLQIRVLFGVAAEEDGNQETISS